MFLVPTSRRRATTLAALLIGSSILVADPARAHQAEVRRDDLQRLDVDLGSNTGPFHGGASGTLYGLYDQRLPFPNLIEGIKLRTVSTKAQDGPQHPGADGLEVAKLLVDASGGDTYIYMTDIHREFPYNWKTTSDCRQSVDAYLEKLRVQTEQVSSLDSRYRDRIVFVPFNEPEGNMFRDGERGCDGINWLKDPAAFFDAWDRAYRLIRGIIPNARIAGPNTSILYDQVYRFLDHSVKAGTVPHVMTWHELSNPATVRASVERFRSWEKRIYAGTSRAGTNLPININEYAYNYHTSVPGQMVQWLSAIEDSKVDADIAYWNIDGNLSDSAVQANRGNGQWWLLNSYAGMSGHTVKVKPSRAGESYTLQGVATLDVTKRHARLLFGGKEGAAAIAMNNIPASFGSTVRARVREIPWSGQLGDAPPPASIADVTLPVGNGSLEMTFGGEGILPALREESAYELIVTPGRGSGTVTKAGWRQDYEAEKGKISGAGLTIKGPEGSPKALQLFYTSGGYSLAGFQTGSDAAVDIALEIPQDGTYDVRVLANTFNKDPAAEAQGPTNVFLRIDGRPESEVEMFLPLGYKPSVWDHVDTQVKLTRGHHVLTLATRSLDGERMTRGNALVDRVTLSLVSEVAQDAVYEAQYADLVQARPVHDRVGSPVRLLAGASATFWVYAAREGLAALKLDRTGSADADLTVNGQLLSKGATKAFLNGGINKITVTGGRTATFLRGLRVGPVADAKPVRSYEAEDATVAGTVKVVEASLASGGRGVADIGGEPGNGNTLTFGDVTVDRGGSYALTIRYSNDEQSKATHYNPDPLARTGRISVNGAAPILVTFPNSFHRNNWWELTVPVTLKRGSNSIRFSGEEQPNWDGRTYASQVWPGVLLRSRYAPNIDQITITSMSMP